MDKNLNELLIIDQELGDFYYDNNHLSDNEFLDKLEETKYIDRALKIINKMSSKNVLEVIKRAYYLTDFIDMKVFLKPYKINKKQLKEDNSLYKDEYIKLRNTCLLIDTIIGSEEEFNEYMRILDVDNVEKYLLNNMPNEQIYSLASETDVWDEKLFYYSFLKK